MKNIENPVYDAVGPSHLSLTFPIRKSSEKKLRKVENPSPPNNNYQRSIANNFEFNPLQRRFLTGGLATDFPTSSLFYILYPNYLLFNY